MVPKRAPLNIFRCEARAGVHGGAGPDPPLHQREHQLARRHVVLLRGARPRLHDARAGLLPQEVLRGQEGRLK